MKTITGFLAGLILLIGCQEEDMAQNPNNSGNNENNNPNSTEWLIPENEVRDGGPGKDGIPAIDNPDFISPSAINYLSDEDLVLGFADGNDVRTYPHPVLDWHEIINDDTPNYSIAVIYCPLTGTGIGWNREIDGNKTTFGVSGLLYNSNIIPYDRATDSNWSQLLLKSVNGKHAGKEAKTFNLVETFWKTWKATYPNSKVVSTKTGYNRNYGRYPYGSYKTSNNLIFPIANNDPRLQPKERVLTVIIDGDAKAFHYGRLEGSNNLFYNTFKDVELVISGNKNANLMVAYNRVLADGTELDFQYLPNQLPALMKDTEGTTWDVFGRAIDGPRIGEKLRTVPQMMGYWFAFAAFYPEIEM
jgi:hypothetical protein